ncbi:MAG TPA: hypothetical protein VGT24_09425 [Candidatus Acidoferrales bacterium]|nr:hypothetical protein [Candidatus Acidoferrales bacterium]
MGALAGRAANEQMTAMSWGRRSGGAGVGFEAGLEQPLTLATQQQQFQRGGLENQLLQNQVNFAPQLNQLNMAAKFAEIQKNISDAQKNRYVTPRSGGVYDVQSGQFAPGTEPQDKLSTMQGLLADAASKAQAAGRDPKQDATVQQYSDIITGLQRDVQPKTQNDFQQYYAKYLSDNNLPDTAANMQKAHQMFEVKPVQPGAGDARLDRSYQFNSTQLEKVRQPVDAVATRLGNLEASLNQGTPQADALIAPELLSIMAGGSGSGLRMNEAEINRIVGGRSNWQSLQAAVNKWQLDPKAANSITPAQRSQIRSLYQVVASKVAAKQQALSQAEGALVDANDPTTHRRIVSQLRQTLTGIDAGGGGGQIQVQDPNGGIHTFPDQASAARFKQLAGIP